MAVRQHGARETMNQDIYSVCEVGGKEEEAEDEEGKECKGEEK